MPRDASQRGAGGNANAAVAAVHRADEDAVAAIDAIPGPHRAYQRATQLADVPRDAAEYVADLRARNAAWLQAVEGLSLAALGQRLGGVEGSRRPALKGATSSGGRR